MGPQHKAPEEKQQRPQVGKQPGNSAERPRTLVPPSPETGGGKWKRYISKPANQVALATLGLLVITIGIYIYQAYLTRDQEHGQLRAYVGPYIGGSTRSPDLKCSDCAIGVPVGDIASKDSLSIAFKNFGSTPAYRPETCIVPVAVAVNSVVSPRVASEKLKICALIRRRTIWPGEERVYRFSFNESTVDMIRHVRSKQFPPYSPFDVYIVGFVSYDDIFGATHKTYICLKYEFSNGLDWFEDTGDIIARDY